MTTEPLATNAHHKGVAPEDMARSGLDEMFRSVELGLDRFTTVLIRLLCVLGVRGGRVNHPSALVVGSHLYIVGVPWQPE